jgi:superfamily II DNA or RNA helicase
MAEENDEVAYIAPTSYGKSSVMIDYIRRHLHVAAKIAIIVPKKSLLMQTYRIIRGANLGRRLLMHDEMYNQEQRFIAILTQERCLRLLVKSPISFDLMFIDEAHNLLENDERAILLARLIKRNKARNVKHRVLYLSPLIQDAGNLKVSKDQQIMPYAVPFNIKEPDIFEYRLTGVKYQYNRFVNEFYELDKYRDIFHYIIEHARLKNFLFCNRPILIEQLAKLLTARLPLLRISRRLREVINTLKEEVHEQFFLADYLEKGVVYLHGKLPDLIKEYVESKFTDIPELKYLIANAVILEGMNLPIDNLYILSASVLNPKQTTNLIGRVNRLNTIFGNDLPPEALEKLHPPIHFVNSSEYNRENGNMANNIKELRSRVFDDEIENCTLANYDVDRLKKNKKDKISQRIKDDLIISFLRLRQGLK